MVYMKHKDLPVSPLPFYSLKQKNKKASFTNRYEFYLLDGEVFARDKSKFAESRDWIPLLHFKTHSKLSTKLRKFIEEKKIVAITSDEGNLNLITENGRVLYAKLDSGDDQIEWIKHWGLFSGSVFKERTLYVDPLRYQFISSSHCPPYKGRPDGKNKIQGCLFGISGLYAYDTATGYIVYTDPWWRSKFSHMLFTPNGLGLKGMSVSASTIATVTQNNEVYTRLVDIDTGDNVAINSEYSLKAMENNFHPEINTLDLNNFRPATPLSAQFIKEIFKTRNLPISIWHNHPIPDDFLVSGAITILQNGPNVRDDFELRVWGYKSGKYGYITKQITDTVADWTFKRQKKTFQPETQDTIAEVQSLPTKLLSGRLGFWGQTEKNSIELTIEAFNPYKDYNLVEAAIGEEKFHLYLFILSQVHFRHHNYSSGTLMLSSELKNSQNRLAQRFVKIILVIMKPKHFY